MVQVFLEGLRQSNQGFGKRQDGVWGALEVFGRSCGVSKDICDLCEGHNRSGRSLTWYGGLCQHLGSINEWQSYKVTQIELDKQ